MDLLFTETDVFVQDSKAWLRLRLGVDDALPITLGLAGFTEATHYPDGFIRSGTVIALNTTTGLYVPYTNAGADGTGIPAGHLLNAVKVNAGATKAASALLWIGCVKTSKLPPNHGLHLTDRPTMIKYVA